MTEAATKSEMPHGAAIRIGISSWTDLPGFYPSGIKAASRLAWYARNFDIAEINTSFYRVVAPETYQSWLDQTPSSLTFDVKAFRELTHERHSSPAAIFLEFHNSLQPLRADNRLGSILFQFPPRFTNTPANRDYLAALPIHMQDDRIVIEFRHASWLDAEHKSGTIEFLRDRNMTLVVVDEPVLPPHTVPLVPIVTCDALSYVRLHGRNAEGWFGGRESRYAYEYSSAELVEIASVVRNLVQRSHEVHVLFNNNSTGAGTINAQQLASMLGVASTSAPERPLRQATLLKLP